MPSSGVLFAIFLIRLKTRSSNSRLTLIYLCFSTNSSSVWTLLTRGDEKLVGKYLFVMEIQEKLEMELKKHTEEAASRVTAVLQRAEEQGRMIESLHTSVRASLWPNFVFLLLILFIFLCAMDSQVLINIPQKHRLQCTKGCMKRNTNSIRRLLFP